jgi:hypothetical protein
MRRIHLDGTRPGSLVYRCEIKRSAYLLLPDAGLATVLTVRRWVREEEQDQTFRSSLAIRLVSSGEYPPYPERTALPAIDL